MVGVTISFYLKFRLIESKIKLTFLLFYSIICIVRGDGIPDEQTQLSYKCDMPHGRKAAEIRQSTKI